MLTVLFVNSRLVTAGILIIQLASPGTGVYGTSWNIVRHAHMKGVEYEKAYVIRAGELDYTPFWVRTDHDENEHEVECALRALRV